MRIDNDNAAFCASYDAGNALYGYFSTSSLLQRHGNSTAVAIDYTYKRTGCGLPVTILGNVDPPSRLRLLTLGFSAKEDQNAPEWREAKRRGAAHLSCTFVLYIRFISSFSETR